MELKFKLLLLVAINSINLHAQDKVSILADPWCPFTCAKEDEVGNGILLDIAEMAFAGKDKKIDYAMMPWARAIETVRMGKSDAVAGAYQSDAPDFIFTDEALFQSTDCFFSLKENKFNFTGIASLAGKQVGIIQNYSYGDEIDSIKDSQEGKKIFQAVGGESALTQNAEKLLKGRLDYILENREVMAFNRGKNKNLAAIKPAYCFKPKGIYLAFSPAKPASKELVKVLNSVMKTPEFKKNKKALMKQYSLN